MAKLVVYLLDIIHVHAYQRQVVPVSPEPLYLPAKLPVEEPAVVKTCQLVYYRLLLDLLEQSQVGYGQRYDVRQRYEYIALLCLHRTRLREEPATSPVDRD